MLFHLSVPCKNGSKSRRRKKSTKELRSRGVRQLKTNHKTFGEGREGVCWPKDAQTPTGLTRHVRDLHTYPTRQLRAQAEEQQHQRPAGRRTDRVTRGVGGHPGRGGARPSTHPARPGAEAQPRPILRRPAGVAAGAQPRYALLLRAGTGSAPPEEEEGPPAALGAGALGAAAVHLRGAVASQTRSPMTTQDRECLAQRLLPAAALRSPSPLRAPGAFHSLRWCAPCHSVPRQKVCAVFAETSHLSRAGRTGLNRPGCAVLCYAVPSAPHSPSPAAQPLLRCDPALPAAPPSLHTPSCLRRRK